MAIDFEKHNQDVKEWTAQVVTLMKQNAGVLGIAHRSNSPSEGASMPKLKSGFKYDTGAIEVISFKFPRSLIYVHKGAGKGRGGTSGSTWLDRYGKQKKTNPNSMGKMDTAGRKAKPWFEMTLNGKAHGVEQLADLVAKNLGSTISNNILK